MKDKFIEIYSHDSQGYNPCLIAGAWQAAFLNYAPEENLESITKLDIHHLTDEAFVLLKGEVTIIAAQVDGCNVDYEAIRMSPGLIYNIPRETWHKVAMEEGSSLLIIENSSTHISDFEFFDLSEQNKKTLIEAVNKTKVR